MPFANPMVVFSHLRWDFVFQRPQHLVSRFAAARRVVFVEEPVHDPTRAAGWERRAPLPTLAVYRPHTPAPAAGFHASRLESLLPLVDELHDAESLDDAVAWLYTPLAVPLARRLDPAAVVYDCMDELSLFRGAPPELIERERELLAWADVVFTGGPSLHRSKRDRHPDTHCFPSSVDAAHFGRARPGTIPLPEPPDQAPLGRPRLGYCGVIDERMDLPLLAATAEVHPEWEIVMVGPVVKIDPASLPVRPNLHYLGQRGYDELPAYLAGWDVCLLPFALNEATRFISPTKTLEYMAAERPIVSTPITDVAEPYDGIVHLGDGVEAFIAACERALSEPPHERAARTAAMRRVIAGTSWDATAAAMERLVAGVLAPGPLQQA